nr:ribonuclease H-like domain-containing protein [Tanacetum cinerariifolium]
TEVSTCFKACLKSYETLKEHYDNFTKDFNDSQFNLGAYKAGLESVEAKIQKRKDDLKLTLEKFKGSSKNLSRLLDSQQCDKSKTGLGYDSQGVDSQVLKNQMNDKYNTCKGYHAVLPPYTGNCMPPKPNLVFADEHVVSESVTSLLNIAKSEVKTSETKLKNVSAPIIEYWVSNSEDEDEIETEKSVKQKESNRQRKYPRKTSQSPRVLTNSGLKTLNTTRHPSSRAAVSVNTARLINTAYPISTMNGAKPSSNIFHQSHSTVKRTFNQRTAPQNSDLKETVNSTKGNPQFTLQDQGIFNSGCSRHMTGNKSFLTDYQEIDGGFVAFVGSPKGGKIYGKGKIRTEKLDFEDVYFVKELKFNLFSVSQMCEKKNSVLSTETECLVLSPDFKLLDENQVLLKVPRQNNMYNFDLKNVAPSGGFTCLFANATIDESNLWHRRLGHISFKTINKLMRGNLVRGLPSKMFENDHTYVACQKGKQHKASYHLGVFEGMADEGFLVGYSINSKAFRVFNSRTRKVEENLDIRCLENKSNVVRRGLEWLFDIDSLINSMNYELVTARNQTNDDAVLRAKMIRMLMRYQEKEMKVTNISTNSLNINIVGSNDPSMPSLEEIGIFDDVYDEREVGAEADTNNLELLTIMDVKSVFLYGIIEEEVYVCQPPGFEDLHFPNKAYKVKQKDEGIYISQDKYVADILKKFDFTNIKTASTPMKPNKALIKDAEAKDVDVHLYRLIIGSLMYLIASRPDIMFVVCACARDSLFKLEAFSDSDYTVASFDRKSTTGGCQFLGKRLISWQCKKQTIVANTTTEAEYVATASCCGHVLWIQNQMLDYGLNFMNTKIYIDNESTICIVKTQCFTLKPST